MENKQRADERKIEKDRHYDSLETDVREEARKNFKRKPYQIKDTTRYVAKKYGIGGDANGQANIETVQGTETRNKLD